MRPAPTKRSVPPARWTTPENEIARRPQSVSPTAHVLYFGGYATGTLHHARSVSVSRRTCAASARSCSFAASAADSETGAFPGRGDSARAATASRDSAATRSGPGTAAGTDREHIDHNPQHGAVRCPSRTRSTTVLAVTRSSDRSGICHSPGPYPGWLQLPVTDNRPSGPRSRNCASRSGTSGARRRPLGSVTWVGGLVR